MAKWRVLQAAISAWQEVAQMTDAQLAWQMLDEFPLSDEAVRLGAPHLQPCPNWRMHAEAAAAPAGWTQFQVLRSDVFVRCRNVL